MEATSDNDSAVTKSSPLLLDSGVVFPPLLVFTLVVVARFSVRLTSNRALVASTLDSRFSFLVRLDAGSYQGGCDGGDLSSSNTSRELPLPALGLLSTDFSLLLLRASRDLLRADDGAGS